jgi:hypothetical protein
MKMIARDRRGLIRVLKRADKVFATFVPRLQKYLKKLVENGKIQ